MNAACPLRYCGVGLPDVLLHLPAADLIAMSGGCIVDLGHTDSSGAAKGSDVTVPSSPASPAGSSGSADQSPLSKPSTRGLVSRRRRQPRSRRTPSLPETGPSADGLDDALATVARVAKAGWGRRHIRFDSSGSGGGVSSGHRSNSGASSSGGGWGDEVSNGDVLLELSRVLAHHGLHKCPVLRRMLQV